MFEKIELYLNANAEYAWMVVLFFAFIESFVLSGIVTSSAILCFLFVFSYTNTELLSINTILLSSLAVLGCPY